jgi:hypothetical protein
LNPGGSSPDCPGDVPDNDLASRVAAYLGVADDEAPRFWTPEVVAARMVEAYEVLARRSVIVGPKEFGCMWPAVLQDPPALAELPLWLAIRKEWEAGVAAAANRPSSLEIDRSNEALSWCAEQLTADPRLADALSFWAFCRAVGIPLRKALHRRKSRAERLASARGIGRGRRGATPVDERAREAARAIVTTANIMIAQAQTKLTEALKAAKTPRRAKENRERYQARIRRAARAAQRAREQRRDALQLARRRFAKEAQRRGLVEFPDAATVAAAFEEVMPGRVLTYRALSTCRKQGAAAIAAALNRRGVPVRMPSQAIFDLISNANDSHRSTKDEGAPPWQD